MFNDMRMRLRALFRKRASDIQLDDELQFHFEHQLDKYLQQGLARDEAVRRVHIDFGGINQIKEECRDARGVQIIDTMLQDVRYAFRTLRKSPGFTLVALLTLALGIGVNTAIFSVVYGVLLRPLPYKDPARLVLLHETTPRVGVVAVSYSNYVDWRSQNRSFSGLAAVNSVGFNMSGMGQPEAIVGQAVTSDFFSMLGVQPILGRAFTSEEDKPGTSPVVLLSYQLWQSHFGADPNVLGRSVFLDHKSFVVAGVLPPNFRWIEKTDVIEPFGVWATGESTTAQRGDRGDMVVLGQLKERTQLQQARADMERIAAQLAKAYPDANDLFGVKLEPLRDAFVSEIRPAILVLLCAVVFVLLIACANLANLFLMRSANRTKEISMRLAIGAGRGRIIRQLLTESFVLAGFGGLAGVLLAGIGIKLITRLLPTDALSGASIELNVPVLAFAAAAVLASMILFGLAPAIQSSRADVQSSLKDGGRSVSSGRLKSRWRGALVTAEVSLALVLMVGAGLMTKSLYKLLTVDSGIRPERVLTVLVSLTTGNYKDQPAIQNFWTQVVDRARAIPGVEQAGLGTAVPLTDSHWRTDIMVEGAPIPSPGNFPHPDMHVIDPGYLPTLGVKLISGRNFSQADDEKAPRVALVNAMLASKLYPGGAAVGKRLLLGRPYPNRPPKWAIVVGIVGDTKMYGLANPARLEVYLPLAQRPSTDVRLLLRSHVEPAALTSAVRAAVAAVDKDQPIADVVTMNEVINRSISTPRITLVMLGLFSFLALLLAAIGVYGVLSYSVAQRSHEIGIRMALGAQPSGVLRMILKDGMKLAGFGVIIGLLASWGLARLLTDLLYAVSATDPWTFASVALLLTLIAIVASYIPARRTLSIQPVRALRHE